MTVPDKSTPRPIFVDKSNHENRKRRCVDVEGDTKDLHTPVDRTSAAHRTCPHHAMQVHPSMVTGPVVDIGKGVLRVVHPHHAHCQSARASGMQDGRNFFDRRAGGETVGFSGTD